MNRAAAVLMLCIAAGPTAAQTASNPNWTRPAPAPGHEYSECVCTNRGERVPLGGTSCIRVGGREFTAICGESVNVNIWRKLRDGCEAQPGS